MIRRYDQILAAFAPVRPWPADVDHPAEPVVVDGSEKLWRHFQDHRPIRQVERPEGIDRVGVGGQKQGFGVHQLREDDDLIILHAGAVQPLSDRLDADALQRVHEHLEGVREVEVVIHPMEGVCAWCAILELKRANSQLNLVRRDELRGDFSRLGDAAGEEGGCGEKHHHSGAPAVCPFHGQSLSSG